MKPTIDQVEILKTAGEIVDDAFVKHNLVNEGADHIVLKVRTKSGKDMIVKAGPHADTDAYALTKIQGLHIKAPRVLGEGVVQQDEKSYPLVVMTSFHGVLLAEIERGERYRYIKQIVEELEKVHSMKSPQRAGAVLDVARGKDWLWKEFLMRNVTGENPEFNWGKVFSYKGIKTDLVKKAIENAKEKIEILPEEIEFCLIHCDVQGTNIFVKGGRLEGIIDWSEAKFGDPLFDFARFRMNIRQRMDRRALQEYDEALGLSEEQKKREETYYLLNVLDYVNWYVGYGWDDMIVLQMNLLQEITV